MSKSLFLFARSLLPLWARKRFKSLLPGSFQEWIDRQKALHEEPSYEPDLRKMIAFYVRKGDTCVDVGAHLGIVTGWLLSAVGRNGKVYAFEAHPRNALFLKKRFHHDKRVVVENKAIVDRSSGDIPLYPGRKHSSFEWRTTPLKPEDTPVCLIPTISLDEYFSPETSIHFIKIDVEGEERRVLLGSKRILQKDRPILFVEFHDDEGWEVTKILIKEGYRLYLPTGEEVFPTDPRTYHIVAIPEEKPLLHT